MLVTMFSYTVGGLTQIRATAWENHFAVSLNICLSYGPAIPSLGRNKRK